AGGLHFEYQTPAGTSLEHQRVTLRAPTSLLSPEVCGTGTLAGCRATAARTHRIFCRLRYVRAALDAPYFFAAGACSTVIVIAFEGSTSGRLLPRRCCGSRSRA